MTDKQGVIVEISDSGFVQEIRRVRLQIDAELKKLLSEYEDLEKQVKKGGLQQLGTAQKSYYNMLIELKKQRMNVMNSQIANAKGAAELQVAFNNLQKEIDDIRRGLLNESGKTIKRSEKNPYTASRTK